MKKQLQKFALLGSVLCLTCAATCEPATAYPISIMGNMFSLEVHNGEVSGSTIFGYRLNNTQSIALGGTVVALLCSGFLFQRVLLRTCNCCCGPGKCECGCGCKNTCPCVYRDKSAHNDQARRRHYNDWY